MVIATVIKYANQKQITIHKELCDTKNIYMKTNKQAMFEAMRTFAGQKAPSFQLWCYLSANQDNYTFALSPQAILEAIGMKRDAYNTAVANLIDARYLILKDGSKTIYDFYEIPQTAEESKEG